MNEDQFREIFKKHLKVENITISIESLSNPRKKSKIDYTPYYQRNYVWDNTKATHFIESIFLGTELPPLIFFNKGEKENSAIEIIDGRQRYETIIRFMNDEFSLKSGGLNVLSQLKNIKYSSLKKKSNNLINIFFDCKIRIIEFQIVNVPPLEYDLQDQIKKEIFLRYNTGITPLKKEEIDDAKYDKEDLTNYFKNQLKKPDTMQLFSQVLYSGSSKFKKTTIAKIMDLVRWELILQGVPISDYARGSIKKYSNLLFDRFIQELTIDIRTVYLLFHKKLTFLKKLIDYSENNNLKINHLALRAVLWAYNVLDVEKVNYRFDNKLIKETSSLINDNIDYYSTEYSSRRENIENRYIIIQQFIEDKYVISLSAYSNNSSFKSYFDKIKKDEINAKPLTKLDQLEEMRLSKSEPTNMSIEDLTIKIKRQKFLVRPSYQRIEVINQIQKSSIIESVLLGIKLPPIFINKTKDSISEVIDGQQRLLTLLGFMGEEYLDQDSKLVRSNHHKFKLRGLKILSELNNKSFDDLSEKQKNIIYDFSLFIVEIDSKLNVQFSPIDLFIRLNNKPYPIKANSFEMWNSWVKRDIIDKIKKVKEAVYPWFYIKKISKSTDRDRMENEDLITALCYIEYYNIKDKKFKTTEVYQRDNIDIKEKKSSKLNARISTKVKINDLFETVNQDEKVKENYNKAIRRVYTPRGGIFQILRLILIDRAPTKQEEKKDFYKTMYEFLEKEINNLFGTKKRKLFHFYFLWILISPLNRTITSRYRKEIKKNLKEIFLFIINDKHEGYYGTNGLVEEFNKMKESFHINYTTQNERKLKLSKQEVSEKLKEQSYKDSISNNPLFPWDDVDAEHTIPLAAGGKDDLSNITIADERENKKKGSKFDEKS